MWGKALRKIPCLVIILLFCLSSILPMVDSIYVEKSIDNLENVLDNGLMDSPWPMFGHDTHHTGRSLYGTEGKYLVEKWRFDLAGEFANSPIIDRNGTIYISITYPDYRSDVNLWAINPNGTEKWRFNITGRIEHQSPAISEDGTIYVGDSEGYLYAINSNNGTLKWKTKLKKHIISSPAIADDGTIYLGADNKMCAVNSNGTIKWTYDTGEAIRASPAIGDDGVVYVSSHDGYFYAFYPNSGILKWRVKIGNYIDCYSSPAIDDNGIIYVGGGHKFFAIYQNGSIKWSSNPESLFGSSPVIDYDGTVYTSDYPVMGAGGDVYAFYPDNGALKWKKSILYPEGNFAISNSSNIFLCGEYTTRAKFFVLSPIDGITISYLPSFTGWLNGGPVIGSDGTVYVSSVKGYLHAVELKEHAPKFKINLKGKLGRVEIKFENIGDVTATNISYIVSAITDPFALREPSFNGTISSLEPGEIVTRDAWFIFGMGIIFVDVKIMASGANSDQFSDAWSILGPFIWQGNV